MRRGSIPIPDVLGDDAQGPLLLPKVTMAQRIDQEAMHRTDDDPRPRRHARAHGRRGSDSGGGGFAAARVYRVKNV